MKPVPKSPRDVSILVTARCNLKCKHCSVYGEGPIEGDLSVQQWCNIIRRLSQWKVLKLTVSGGEPLARDGIGEIVRAVRSNPFRFSLNTNAMLVTDAIAVDLAEARPRLDSVMVSLDGACPETHDAQRAPGSFEAMAEGVERLRRAGVPVGFYCTVTTINLDEIEAIAEWGLARGSYVKLNDVLSVGRACGAKDLALSGEQRKQAGERILALSRRADGRISGTLVDIERRCRQIREGTAPKKMQGSRGCGAMRAQVSIFPDGRMTPCDRIPHFTIGNVTTSSLDELWRGDAATKFRDMLAVPLGDLDECRACSFLEHCTGGCPVLPMRSSHGILQRDPLSCVRDYMNGNEIRLATQ